MRSGPLATVGLLTSLSLSVSVSAFAELEPPMVWTSVEATAGSLTEGPTTDASTAPGLASGAAAASEESGSFDVGFGITVENGSFAAAEAAVPGDIGAYSAAGGVGSLVIGDSRVAEASAGAITRHVALSSDPSVDTAEIDVTFAVDGFILFSDYCFCVVPTAHVGTYLRASTMDAELFSIDMEGSYGAASGPWASAWLTSFDFGFNSTRLSVDYSETFTSAFTVTIGEPFTVEMALTTLAETVPFETWLVVDFLDTVSFDLSSSTPGVMVQMSAVPIPPSIALLLAPLVHLLARRRRKNCQ